MRFDLKVPFAEKDAAKALGARWDAANKLWYVADKADMAPFAKWSPTPREATAGTAQSALKRPAVTGKPQTQTSGLVQIGSKYVEQTRSCACLPWEVCDSCRATAL